MSALPSAASPSAFPAAVTTANAIVNLGGCFALVVGDARAGFVMLGVFCVMVLTSVAVYQWYTFVIAYVDHRTTHPVEPAA